MVHLALVGFRVLYAFRFEASVRDWKAVIQNTHYLVGFEDHSRAALLLYPVKSETKFQPREEANES